MTAADEPEWPSPELAERPYAFYERLRRDAPVWQNPATGEFLVARWHDIVRVADDPELFGQYAAVAGGGGLSANGMAASDGLDHRRKRTAALPVVSRSSVAGYEDAVRSLSHALIDGFAGRTRVALWDDYARILPAAALVEILGLPAEDAARFAGWFGGAAARSSRLISERELISGAGRAAEAKAHVQRALLERHRAPRGDALSAWVQRLGRHEPWEALEYLATEVVFLFFAGYLPVASLVTSGLVLLLRHPAILDDVRRDPALIPDVVEEALRLDPPIQWLNRTARDETEVAGVKILAGSTVVLLWGSGCRDEARFDEPDEFRPGRPALQRNQLGLGRGPHLCLGAPLVRLQARIALESLLERLPTLRLADPLEIDHRRERIPQRVELELG